MVEEARYLQCLTPFRTSFVITSYFSSGSTKGVQVAVWQYLQTRTDIEFEAEAFSLVDASWSHRFGCEPGGEERQA